MGLWSSKPLPVAEEKQAIPTAVEAQAAAVLAAQLAAKADEVFRKRCEADRLAKAQELEVITAAITEHLHRTAESGCVTARIPATETTIFCQGKYMGFKHHTQHELLQAIKTSYPPPFKVSCAQGQIVISFKGAIPVALVAE